MRGGGPRRFLAKGKTMRIEGFEINVSKGHDHAGVFEADDVIRGNLFLYHISLVVNEGYAMFWWEGSTEVVCKQCPKW